MAQTFSTLAVDFGTSNSAVGYAVEGQGRLIEMEAGGMTLPTALFIDSYEKKLVYGSPAQEALIAGVEGRYMRALKSLLGTALMRESRMVLGRRMDFIALVGGFLAELKARAEAATGQTFTHALSGRPVLFHSANEARNAQALVDLRECYQAAGFEDVAFMAEPAAAALANRDTLEAGDLALIVDIGGGTSDFTLFRQGAQDGIDILVSHGLRLGGTNFDREISLDQVMPVLGLGSQIRHVFGDESHAAPQSIFDDLATWQKIPFLYTHETRRAAADLAKYAEQPELLNRLVMVLEEELGHDIAFAVEAGKIAANTPNASAPPEIKLGVLERDLRLPLPAAMLTAILSDMAAEIVETAVQTATMAQIEPSQVTRLILVGGSSLMGVIETALQSRFPQATMQRGSALTAIIDGLAIASASAFD